MGARRPSLREAAEDLRDAAAKFCAAVIGGRLDEAAYAFHADLSETFREVEAALAAVQSDRR
jgi:predicted lipoprotein